MNTKISTTLKKYEASLNSVKRKKTIQGQLSEFGYTAEFIAEGQALLHETVNAIKEMEIQYNKKSEGYQTFMSLYNELSKTYSLHKKIAQIN